MRRTILSATFAGVLGLAAALSARAAEPSVMRVIVVQTGDVPGYAHEIEALQALYKKIGLTVTIRAWRATYAGPDTGAIIVSIEVPSLAALAKLTESARTNPEVAAEMKKINGMRKIVSDSLYDSLSP
jgi:hypothetical protein